MWNQSFVRIGEHDVRLSVRRLDSHECQQIAASLAWLTLGALQDDETASWEERVGGIITEHVSFNVGVDDLSGLAPEWWSALLNAALLQLMRENDLATLVHQHLSLLQSGPRPEGRAS